MNNDIRLIYTINGLRSVVGQIDVICGDLDVYNSILRDSLLVDKKPVKGENLNVYKNNLYGIRREITYGVIPRINNYL